MELEILLLKEVGSMTTKIKPLKNRILIQVVKKKLKEGLILPDNFQEGEFGLPNQGKIVQLGSKVDKQFKLGDVVVFKRLDAIHVSLTGADTDDGKEVKYLLIEDSSVLGILDER